MKKEIERKFLINSIPREMLAKAHLKKIRQGYIVVFGDTEVRIRSLNDEYFLTIKIGKGIVREEMEIPIDIKKFKSLWNHTQGKRIVKNRYVFKIKNNLVELDKYLDKNKGLIVAEIEFKSLRSSNAFIPPAWFGREITGVDKYRNQNLAQ